MKIRFHHDCKRGIALVITLIMLSVTLVMAVAFLAISNRERNSVTTVTDAAHARLAADAALAHAEAQIAANIMGTTNAYNFGLLVSTNYVNYTYGFLGGISNPTNVSYNYTNGNFLAAGDLQQNIANLLFLPRAPVFVPTNNTGGLDFRFYLDLNRNGLFDPNNNVSNWLFLGTVFTNAGAITEVGDPEWVGVLEHPDAPHSPENKFIARYAFLAVPVGNTLDVNAIYNDALAPNASMITGSDGFLRNEGVGSWELNLAAFLADLNTNEWDAQTFDNQAGIYYGVYGYQEPFGSANSGAAFNDALGLLGYRYYTNVFNQLPASLLTTNLNGFKNIIDSYSVGPLMTSNNLPAPLANYTKPWAGAANTNHFFTPADFFDKSKTEASLLNLSPKGLGFTDRLLQAGTNAHGSRVLSRIPTYDRYTFYRLLSQLGTDTTPDYNKINLNYVNVDNQGNIVPGMETNYLRWNALQFFTNAADHLLRTYTTNWYNANFAYFTNTFGNYTAANGGIAYITPFGITNIPVLVNGRFVYTPAVHRLLQLAANIFDATTNNFYPSVFRPTFYRDPYNPLNVFINGYQYIPGNINGTNDLPLNRLSQPVSVALLTTTNIAALNNINVYGVPWIIGAKKGMPNFNELNVLNTVQVSRLLQVNRRSTNNYDSSNYTTNQMFVMSISNSVGMSLWNSYNSDYVGSGNIEIFAQEIMQMGLTNSLFSGSAVSNFNFYANYSYWPGSGWLSGNAVTPPPVPASFIYTNWTASFLPPKAYEFSSGLFLPFATTSQTWASMGTDNYPFPQFGYMTTNWLQAFVLDGPVGAQHVIDYVQFSGPNNTRNITAEIADPNYSGPPQPDYQWSTNGYLNETMAGNGALATRGEINQLFVSRGLTGYAPPPGGTWATTASFQGNDGSIAAQQAFFNGFFLPSFTYNKQTYANTEYSVQAPYTPTRTMYDYTLWQANDPLVHYLASDLSYIATNGTGVQRTDLFPPVFNIVGLNLNQIGNRYQPWGKSVQMAGMKGVDANAYNLAFKDPLVWGSDYWDFPTNLFPSVGWLGRVHRGTPWQTVFLKSTNLLSMLNYPESSLVSGLPTWQIWSGNTGNAFDATNAAPVYDRLLFDVFTTEPNENATLGKLSINQTHLAAWSALFSGLVVNTNLPGTNYALFQPAGPNYTNYIPGNPNTYLGDIWNSIQQTRANTNLFSNQSFQHIGDLLATPALSDASPFLPFNNPLQVQQGISDEMYEWLPQQVLSLVTVGAPRYVVYCYGQALKPARGGFVLNGPFAGLCTNYQIVSETATRALMQMQMSSSNTPGVILKNLNPLPPDQ